MAAHTVVELHKNLHFLDDCCDLLNAEWPRSKIARLRSLQVSQDGLPTCLVVIKQNKVIGHSKISLIPSVPLACFIESVVVDPNHRGQGLGKVLMLESENYAKKHGFYTVYLSTKDKAGFYMKLGYVFCEPVSIYGCSFVIDNELAAIISPSSTSSRSKLISSYPINPSENISSNTRTQTAPPPPPPLPSSLPPKSVDILNANMLTNNNKVFMKKIL